AGWTHLISAFDAGVAGSTADGGTGLSTATCFARECRLSGGLGGSAAAVLLPAAGCCSGPAALVDVAGCRSEAGAAALFDGCFSGAACFSGAGGALAAGGSSR